MNTLKKLLFCSSLLMTLAMPAFANIVINNPANGATVGSPLTLSATAATCSSQTVTAMGYSFDSSSDTTIVSAQSVNAQLFTSTGWHTVHVKAWGAKGSSCVADVSVTVSPNSSLIPAYATSVGALQTLSNWQQLHDGVTGGTSTGAMVMTHSPSRSGSSRQFYTTYTYNGGERYHVSFGDDESASNFVYDVWIYLTSSAGNIGNLEMDLNQVIPNGQTVIMGMQCDGWTNTWDFTVNRGSATKPSDQWVASKAPCNVRSWGRNQWHHIQLAYSRNDSGWVTYKAAYVDGKEEAINVTAYSAFALGWAPTLLTNFQVDGLGAAGSVNLYMDELTIHRW